MTTQSAPIALTEETWTEVAAGCCTVQAMEGHAWIRVSDAAPAYAPEMLNGREYDGHLIGYRGTTYQSVNYSAEPALKVFARARTDDGAVVVVTDV